MDHWITNDRQNVLKMLKRINGLVLNDSEAKLLTGDENLVRAGRSVLKLGPRFVVVKKGEHGAMFFSEHETYVLPAFPTCEVVDPTGAGDCFAGGMMGYLAEQGNFEPKTLKEAMAYGIVVASFCVEDFSLDRLRQIDRAAIDAADGGIPADVDVLSKVERHDTHRAGDHRAHSADGGPAGRALFRRSRVPPRPRETDPRPADDCRRAERGNIFVATEEDEVVGMVSLLFTISTAKGAPGLLAGGHGDPPRSPRHGHRHAATATRCGLRQVARLHTHYPLDRSDEREDHPLLQGQRFPELRNGAHAAAPGVNLPPLGPVNQ